MNKPDKAVVFLRSNAVAPDPRVEKEAIALYEAGIAVKIVAWDRACRLPDENREYAAIHRVHISAPFGARIRNVPRKARWNLALLGWLIRNRSAYTHIHACDLDTVVPAIIAKKILHKKVVFDIFDNVIVQPNPEKSSLIISLTASVIKVCENWAIRNSDAVILVDECRLPLLIGSHPKKLSYIYNTPHFSPSNCNETVLKASSLKIGYVGIMDLSRGLSEMLDIVSDHPDFSLELAGFGEHEKEVAAKADAIPNVTFYGRVDYDKALDISAVSDVLFAIYDPKVPLHRYSSPNKLFEAMMLGKPIIVARDTGMDKLVEKHQLGIVVEYGNKVELANALDQIAAMEESDKSSLAARSKSIFKENYCWDIMRQRLVNIYRSL
jgi:glycosyltransferase involved in cell wall biosynthesis